MRTGVFREIDEKMAVNCIASMIVRTRLWFSPDKRLGVSEIIDYIFDFTFRGLSSKNAKGDEASPPRYGRNPVTAPCRSSPSWRCRCTCCPFLNATRALFPSFPVWI
ncbi:MAG: hypothetical protein JXA20_19675 [Spirochaetes bacterium]|nr:hypothetical protein [Spirochaetota bacterium]